MISIHPQYIKDINGNKSLVILSAKEFEAIMEELEVLESIKKNETDDEPTKEEILNNIKAGFKEMQLFKKGKLKTTPLNEFLNEL